MEVNMEVLRLNSLQILTILFLIGGIVGEITFFFTGNVLLVYLILIFCILAVGCGLVCLQIFLNKI